MIKEKNRVMLIISIAVAVLSVVVHLMNRSFHLSSAMGHHPMLGNPSMSGLQTIIMLIPLLITAATFILIRMNPGLPAIPFLNTLTLTFSSISMIAGMGGMVEFHFSIFMVLAIIVYYERIDLLLVSTVLFAVQHLLAIFKFGELVFGSSHYSISMILVHIVFVVLFNAGVIYQILARRKVTENLEREQQQKLQTTVEQIIHDTTASSDGVMSNSQLLLKDSKDLDSLSSQIAAIMNELTSLSRSQELGTQNSASALKEIAAGITVIADISAQTSEEVSESSQEVSRGEEHIRSAIEWMDKVRLVMQSAVEKFNSLQQHSIEIGHITAMNNYVSEQTKLLAFNASIEAAKAGEHGSGFAVVAQEIRKLANQSNQSSVKITELIAEIQLEIAQATLVMEQAVEEVEQGNQAVILSGDVFHTISKSIEMVTSSMSTVSTTSQQISANTEGISEAFTGIALSSRELASDVERVSSLSNEQIELIHKCNGLAHSLEDLSKQLNSVIKITRQAFVS